MNFKQRRSSAQDLSAFFSKGFNQADALIQQTTVTACSLACNKQQHASEWISGFQWRNSPYDCSTSGGSCQSVILISHWFSYAKAGRRSAIKEYLSPYPRYITVWRDGRGGSSIRRQLATWQSPRALDVNALSGNTCSNVSEAIAFWSNI